MTLRRLFWLAGLAFGLACLVGWSGPKATAATKTVVDSVGRRVTFNYPVKRLIVTNHSIAEPVRLFGKQNLVVGIEKTIRHRGRFPEMAKQPCVGHQFRGLNWELILSLKPDVIFISHHPAVTPRLTAEAEQLGIPLLAITWHFPQHMEEAAKLLGEVFGERERADEFLKWRRKHIDLVAQRLKDLPAEARKKAYVEVDISGPIGRSPGEGMPSDGALYFAGLINICQFYWSRVVSPEWIMARNPDIIFMNDYGAAGRMTGYLAKDESALSAYIEKVKKRVKFKKTEAVANNNVYLMNSKMRGSIHMVGALYMAKAADRFQDVDPEKPLRELFERWLKLPYRGVWFFPSP